MSQPKQSIYPQSFPMDQGEIEAFLSQPLIAKLSTHNEDGTIHCVPNWFKYHQGEILLGTQEISKKARNIQRDPRVTVLVDTTEPRLKGVMMQGNAAVEYENVIPRRIMIFSKYMDPSEAPALTDRLASSYSTSEIRYDTLCTWSIQIGC